MFDEPIDEEYEALSNPSAQFRGDEVETIAEMMMANDNDPAYVLGVMQHAIIRLMPEKHTTDPAKLKEIRECHEQIKDVMRLRKQWLTDYPDLMAKLEARW